MLFRQLFDPASSTYTYLLADEKTKEAVLIDTVLEQVDRDIEQLESLGLKLVWILDTHVHADHVTGSGTLRAKLGAKSALSEKGGTGCPDVLLKQGDTISFGKHNIEVRETPGHTDACLTFVVRDGAQTYAFTGDALLIRGSGRTDFQQGNARMLFQSVHQQIFTLPDNTFIYPGHDYKGRSVSTVDEEKRLNPRLGNGRTIEEFETIMANLKLAYPKQIDRAVPANLVCGLIEARARMDGENTAQAWAPISTTTMGIPEISPTWVAAHLGEFRLVDVREVSEFTGNLGHISGAELVPLATIEHAAASWDRSAPLVLVCRSGGRSGKAALQLKALGFEKLASMQGGMIAWNNTGLLSEGVSQALLQS